MRRRIFIYLTIFEVIVIGVIGYAIFKKQQNVLGVSVNRINSSDLNSSPSGSLTYFYEPKEGIIRDNPESTPYVATYSINSDSLNSIRDYSISKPNDTFRIITLGDSFTYGLHVDTDKNWPTLLEGMLNKNMNCANYHNFEVINLGVEGYDTSYSVERYRKRGEKYNPDLVIWLHVDLKRVTEVIKPLAQEYEAEARRSGEYEKQISEGKYYEAWIKAWSQINSSWGEEKIKNYQEEALSRLDKIYSGKLVYVVFPGGRISQNESDLLETHIKQRGNGYFDNSLSDITASGDVFAGDGHPNEAGHRKIAEDMVKFITSNKIIDCKN